MTNSARQLLYAATATLHQAGSASAALDARLLLAEAWGLDTQGLIMHMHELVPQAVQQCFAQYLKRRQQREPIAYILGRKEFWSRNFKLNTDVLIPRPESEHIIEMALHYLKDHQKTYHMADIGTGSGCLAVCLAGEFPNAKIHACDISAKALACAQENIIAHGFSQHISTHQGDLYAALDARQDFDLIVSNPPYIPIKSMPKLEPELSFEPASALSDGADGLNLIRRLLAQAHLYLKPNGLLIIETGEAGLPSLPAQHALRCIKQGKDLAGSLRLGIYQMQSHRF